MAARTKWPVVSVFFIVLLVKVHNVSGDAEIMKKMTMGFAKVLEDCKKELSLPDHIIQDFYNFWKEDYDLVNREVGCAIMCMAGKFDLISDDYKIHHGNAHTFAKSHGADDAMAKTVISLIHECEKTHDAIADDCSRVLEVAKCFRTKIHGLKWAPNMETVLGEVMTEVKA